MVLPFFGKAVAACCENNCPMFFPCIVADKRCRTAHDRYGAKNKYTRKAGYKNDTLDQAHGSSRCCRAAAVIRRCGILRLAAAGQLLCTDRQPAGSRHGAPYLCRSHGAHRPGGSRIGTHCRDHIPPALRRHSRQGGGSPGDRHAHARPLRRAVRHQAPHGRRYGGGHGTGGHSGGRRCPAQEQASRPATSSVL